MSNDTIENIIRALGRIEGKLESIDGRFSDIAESKKDHENRIVSLEKERENAKGKLWGISFVVSAAWAIFLALFNK
jgi:hypothetical protein